jgi:hypothetical protein
VRPPYRERRRLLGRLIADGPHLRPAPSWTGHLGDVRPVTRAHELEGVVSATGSG